ncbi:MAG: YwiC-like family protein [Anaerolineae bacterium]|nr:YwiC-like family protein [Anaerolineae bacterium]
MIGLAAFGIFLIHQPLKIAVKDRAKGKRTSRTAWAERFTLLYALLAVVPFLIVWINAKVDFLVPLLLAAPFGLLQLYFDSRSQSRDLAAELAGAVALGAVAPMIALLGGWSLLAALVLWLLLIIRALTSIYYVRARLRLEREKPFAPAPVAITHALGLLLAVMLVILMGTPPLSLLAVGLLVIRAAYGLSRYRPRLKAKQVGIREVIYGLLYAILIAMGYSLA